MFILTSIIMLFLKIVKGRNISFAKGDGNNENIAFFLNCISPAMLFLISTHTPRVGRDPRFCE